MASTVQHEWREKRRLHPEMRDAHSLRGDPNLEEKGSVASVDSHLRRIIAHCKPHRALLFTGGAVASIRRDGGGLLFASQCDQRIRNDSLGAREARCMAKSPHAVGAQLPAA